MHFTAQPLLTEQHGSPRILLLNVTVGVARVPVVPVACTCPPGPQGVWWCDGADLCFHWTHCVASPAASCPDASRRQYVLFNLIRCWKRVLPAVQLHSTDSRSRVSHRSPASSGGSELDKGNRNHKGRCHVVERSKVTSQAKKTTMQYLVEQTHG